MEEEEFFNKNFNTKLSKEDEAAYQQWLLKQSAERGRDMSHDQDNYDMRGYFINEASKSTGSLHFPDTYKKPNHPTFSDQSIYNGAPDPRGGKFIGGKWGKDWSTFTPSAEMLKSIDIGRLQEYLKKIDPNVKLVIPKKKTEEIFYPTQNGGW